MSVAIPIAFLAFLRRLMAERWTVRTLLRVPRWMDGYYSGEYGQSGSPTLLSVFQFTKYFHKRFRFFHNANKCLIALRVCIVLSPHSSVHRGSALDLYSVGTQVFKRSE